MAKAGKGVDDQGPRYSVAVIIASNLILIAMTALAALGLRPLSVGGWPLASVALVLLVLASHLVWLRMTICSRCRLRGRWCHTGWGKIALLYRPRDPGGFERAFIHPLMFWVSFAVLPPLAMAAGLLMEFNPINLISLLLFLALTWLNLLFTRRFGCRSCPMARECSIGRGCC